MPSLIKGFEYDIFISYRQKDNTYDGWVASFVQNLKKELEATFKGDVSIYFDENPHDGLLETHHVAKSLEGKLKCLIFIPIISQTYCDPNSFAWQYEFCAFNKSAQLDQFGRDVKLANGNVASRILPVKIHQLDAEDKALLESELQGVLRAIEFIYTGAGINRPLRSNEEHPDDNVNKTIYRDQINKVANAIKEIVSRLMNFGTKVEPQGQFKIVKPERHAAPAREEPTHAINTMRPPQSSKEPNAEVGKIRSNRKVVFSLALFIAIAAYALWQYYTKVNEEESRIKWAYQSALPKIEGMLDNLFYWNDEGGTGPEAWDAYYLTQQVKGIIPQDPKIGIIEKKCSDEITITSSPAGARVYARPYSWLDSAFRFMGNTPLEKFPFPNGNLSIKLEKEGFEPVENLMFVTPSFGMPGGNYKLDKIGTLPHDMIMVRPHIGTILMGFLRLSRFIKNPDTFLVDRYEVSNKEFMRFIKAGGYRDGMYWKEPIHVRGKTIPWEEAAKLFVDQTGQPGPSSWIAGDFPDGEEDHPVAGVSWYEAAAYAEFVGKKLPSTDHLKFLAGTWAISEAIKKSNLNSQGTRKRQEANPQNLWGVHDLFGNVREWCYNSLNEDFKSIVGAAYNDQDYLANQWNNGRLPIDRGASNGFRCVRSADSSKYNGPLYKQITYKYRNYAAEQPVGDEVFKAYLRQFAYDKSKLRAETVYSRNEEDWTREKIRFEVPYGAEQMDVYLFLPKNVKPPYQTVIYWPGSAAQYYESSEEYLEIGQVDFLIKNGRLVLIPVYLSTYERRKGAPSGCTDWRVCDKELTIKNVQELQKSIDYLESRGDIDMQRIAYFGVNWGAGMGPIALATEKRIKLGILAYGGFSYSVPFPEISPFNYAPRVAVPIILFNGRFDFVFPLKESVEPFFASLGTNSADKKSMLYDDAHLVPRKELIKESLAFLDKYFGKPSNTTK